MTTNDRQRTNNLPISHSPNLPLSQSPNLLILSIYTLLTLLLTYPLPLRLTSAVPNDIGDPLLNTWILAWDSHALLTEPLGLFEANIFHPLPNSLAYSEHLLSTALLALPLQLIAGEPLLAYNLSLLLTFPLAAFGMYLLVLHWTGHRRAAFIAGLIFAFNPYRFAAIAHLQLLTFHWLPFTLLYLDKILTPSPNLPISPPFDFASFVSAQDRQDRFPNYQLPITNRPNPHPSIRWRYSGCYPSIRWRYSGCYPSIRWCYRPIFTNSLLFILFLTLQLLAAWYLAIYTALIIGIYLLIRLLTRTLPLARLPLLIASLLIALLLTLPLALPYLTLIDDLRAARPLSTALSLAAAPTDFLAAAPFNTLFGPLTAPFRTRPGFTEENTLFLGFLAPLLTLLALLPLPKKLSTVNYQLPITNYLKPALLLILLLTLLLTFPTPYTLLTTLLPPSTIIRVPPRWIIPATFALAALAGFGYARLETIIRRAQVSLTAQQLSIPQSPPLPITPSPNSPLSPSPPLSLFIVHCSLFIVHCSFFIILLLLLAESLALPLPLAPVRNQQQLNPAYAWLAAQPGDFSLIELPLHSAPAPEFPEVKRLYASTQGWWSLVNGYSGYTPPRQPRLAQAIADFPAPTAVTALQNLAATLPAESRPLYLLVHPGEAPFDRSHWEETARWQAERQPALLPIAQFEGDYLYRVQPPDPDRFARPLATFGPDQAIRLLDATFDQSSSLAETGVTVYASRFTSPRLRLYWQTTKPLSTPYTLFIHLRAPDGFIRSQADGPPVSGHYPTTVWTPGQIIRDIHRLSEDDLNRADHLAIGLYDPATGERLPAFGPDGQRLPEDAVIRDIAK